jgi:hypothetical protein
LAIENLELYSFRDSYKDDSRIEDRKRDAEGGEDRDV